MECRNDERQRKFRLLPTAGVRPLLLSLVFTLIAGGVSHGLPTRAAEEPGPKEFVKRHPLTPYLARAQTSCKKIIEADDYEATFTRRELIRGRLTRQTMQVKCRHKPFSVYLRFLSPNAGREVIYVAGENKGDMVVQDHGLTFRLKPNAPRAMRESQHPITRFGMANMAQGVIEQWTNEMKFGECDVKYYGEAKLGGAECDVLESSHPVSRKQFKFHMTRLWIEKATGFPVRVEQYGFPRRAGNDPPLIEEYTYSNIRDKLGLGDRDFDVRNLK